MTKNSSDAQSGLPSGYWQDLTTHDFARISPEANIALLPVSAIEQHGAHLPLSTDAVINAGVVEAMLPRLSDKSGVLVLPPLTIGDSIEHTDFPGSLSAGLETVLNLWLDVGRCVALAGIRKMVIFNTHGGQRGHVDQVAVRLRSQYDMMVARANSGNFGKPDGLFSDAERAHGLHGGAIETSLMLHLRPDLVRMDQAINAQSNATKMESNRYLGMERGVGIGWMAQDLHQSGICGDASEATAALGASLLDYTASALATLCDELATTPLTTLKIRRRPAS